jgi:hypothetical protein
MEVKYARCAGLDVHKDTVVACVRCVTQPAHREVRTFGTTVSELTEPHRVAALNGPVGGDRARAEARCHGPVRRSGRPSLPF